MSKRAYNLSPRDSINAPQINLAYSHESDDSEEEMHVRGQQLELDPNTLIADNAHHSPDFMRISSEEIAGIGYSQKKRRKSRIPWDRKPNGDKNGLKRALLSAILQKNVYRSENLDVSFQVICDELSVEGALFAPYGGIMKDAAQKKLVSILQDVQDNLHLDENSNLYTVITDKDDSIVDLGLEVLRQKRDPRNSKHKSDTGNNIESTMLLSPERGEKDADTDDEYHFQANIRIPPRRTFIVEELNQQHHISTINELLDAIPFNQEAKKRFTARTRFQLDRPIHLVLGLFEEVMNSKNCYRAVERDLGLTLAEGAELIEFMRQMYLKYEDKC